MSYHMCPSKIVSQVVKSKQKTKRKDLRKSNSSKNQISEENICLFIYTQIAYLNNTKG